MPKRPAGFEFTAAPDGEVAVTHRGRPATTLRGAAARKFLADAEVGDPQQVMARVTGNYRLATSGRRRTIHAMPHAGGERTARSPKSRRMSVPIQPNG